MRKINRLIALLTGLTVLVLACNKLDDLPYYNNGSPVTLSASRTSVAPTPADSNTAVLTFTWTSPNYGTAETNYKYIVEIDSTGRNFSRKITREVLKDGSFAFTGRELNNILLNYGFALGSPKTLDVRVISSYANNNEKYVSNIVKVAVTPFSDPSVLTGSATTVTCALNTAAQKAITFNWTSAFKGYTGVVTYTLQYDSAGKNFAAVKEIPVGASILTKDLTQGELNETALNSKVAGGTQGKIDYRIKAVTALGAISFSNVFSVTINTYVPILRFYMPGSYQGSTGNGNDWDPATAPEFIRDLRSDVLNAMYYAYVYLPAGAKFKITQGRSWDINYGGTGGNLSVNGADIGVTNAGVYRISFNRVTLKYDIREGRMGFVGGATGAGWDPPSVFPNYALGAPANNLFVGLTDFTSGGWKLIDNNAWDNGSKTVDETRSYGSPNGTGSTLQVNGSNFADITSAGRYRVIWDGRDPNNIKYEMNKATMMKLVGDGINQAGVNDWDPGSSPQMTYSGNGVWTITIALKANKDIKFLAGADWGEFDYEDNSNQSQSVGTPRKIKWEGGGNFKTPAVAGTYTIVLDEKAQTVTIN